jgi:hypothetical protein
LTTLLGRGWWELDDQLPPLSMFTDLLFQNRSRLLLRFVDMTVVSQLSMATFSTKKQITKQKKETNSTRHASKSKNRMHNTRKIRKPEPDHLSFNSLEPIFGKQDNLIGDEPEIDSGTVSTPRSLSEHKIQKKKSHSKPILKPKSATSPPTHPHSCYEYRYFVQQTTVNADHTTSVAWVLSRSNFFCYPLIIITGLPKCSTTALYELLIQYPHARTSASKENCINQYYGKSIVDYLDSLVIRNLQPTNVIINGCIDISNNLHVQLLLRNPNTFYVVCCVVHVVRFDE